MDNNFILDVVMKETAAKVINSMDEQTKSEIITEALARMLEDIKFGWVVSNALEVEAKRIAMEYISRKDVQEKLKQKVIKAVEKVMDGLEMAVAKDLESTLKNRYSQWVERGRKNEE
ncbi:hypothetical protein D2962_08290 [Biomaibacter acetigenes]|uniref:Uncharacterized protein n=1 Tax=Biomaibacter acetigenes TaxID=2316383 RepID=A0A3G2R5D7_9FIRM|nr:hypothetical protein [Biomaibacter acetigenes]AYO30622.1 hypothetical protein D2962_08290 [Biomaibacter acetigenes]